MILVQYDTMRPVSAGPNPPRARIARGLALSLILVGTLAPTAHLGGHAGEGRGLDRLEIDAPLLSKLQTLASGLHHEIILCLSGDVDGNLASVSDFVMPEPTRSTVARSTALPCPVGSLAAWHNHPTVPLATRGEEQYVVESLEPMSLCVLSAADLRTAGRHAFPFVVISVDYHTWCWWTRADVERFRAQGLTTAPSLPGQRSWGALATARQAR